MLKRSNGTIEPQSLSLLNLGDINTAWAKCKRELKTLQFDPEDPATEPSLMHRPYGTKCDKCKGEMTERSRRLKGDWFAAFEKQVICLNCKIEKRRTRVAFNDIHGICHQEGL